MVIGEHTSPEAESVPHATMKDLDQKEKVEYMVKCVHGDGSCCDVVAHHSIVAQGRQC